MAGKFKTRKAVEVVSVNSRFVEGTSSMAGIAQKHRKAFRVVSPFDLEGTPYMACASLVDRLRWWYYTTEAQIVKCFLL